MEQLAVVGDARDAPIRIRDGRVDHTFELLAMLLDVPLSSTSLENDQSGSKTGYRFRSSAVVMYP